MTKTDNIKSQQEGLDIINKHNYIETTEPTEEEIGEIQRTIIKFREELSISYEQFLAAIFQELDIYDLERRKKFEQALKSVVFDRFDRDKTKQFIQTTMDYI